MKIVIAGLLLLALQGCTVIQSAQYAVARYCALPAEARAANREAVSMAIAPNRISIQCAGDRHE